MKLRSFIEKHIEDMEQREQILELLLAKNWPELHPLQRGLIKDKVLTQLNTLQMERLTLRTGLANWIEALSDNE